MLNKLLSYIFECSPDQEYNTESIYLWTDNRGWTLWPVKDPDVEKYMLSRGVKIGRNTIIRDCARIADNVTIGDNCYIDQYVQILEGTIIENNVSIGYCCKISRNVMIKKNSIVGCGTDIGENQIISGKIKQFSSIFN